MELATHLQCRIDGARLYAKIVYGLVLNSIELSAHAQITNSANWTIKYVTAVVLNDVDFILCAWHLGDLAAFTAILAIFSLRMRKYGY